MTEIQFLLDLLLNEKLAVSVKAKLLARIGEVERMLTVAQPIQQQQPIAPNIQPQQPIVTSPVVAAALANRQQLIEQAKSGLAEAGRTSPRKF